MNSREAFEKLITLNYESVKYDESTDAYQARDKSSVWYAQNVNDTYHGFKKAWQEQKQRINDLEMSIKYVLDHFYMNDLDKAMPRVYEDLKEALRGGQ